MDPSEKTLLPVTARIKLLRDKSLGSGNFLRFAAETNPHRDNEFITLQRPFELPDGHTAGGFSLRSLESTVDEFARWYHKAGVAEKDLVAIYLDEGIGFFVHYLALNRLGAIPVLVNGSMDPEIAAEYISRLGVVGLYTDEVHLGGIRRHAGVLANMGFVATRPDEKFASHKDSWPPARYPHPHANVDPVMICHSSGTTGMPKAATFQHEQFFIGKRNRLLSFPSRRSDRMLSALPHSHSAGISYLMTATLLGLPTLVMSELSGHDVLYHIERFAPTVVAGFPQTWAELAALDPSERQLGSVHTWINTGDTAHKKHVKTLVGAGSRRDRFGGKKGSEFIDGLGASEMGMALFRRVTDRSTSVFERCIGKPASFVEKAAVLSDDGRELSAGEVGLLGVKSPTITPGYWNDSDRTFRAHKSGYWTTGDLVYRDGRGRFYQLDRSADAIHTSRGTVFSLPLEELILEYCEELADCTVVGVPAVDSDHQEPIAVVRVKEDAVTDARGLLERLNGLLKNHGAEPLQFLAVARADNHFPVGPTGKVLKRRVRELFQDVARFEDGKLADGSYIEDWAHRQSSDEEELRCTEHLVGGLHG